MSEASLIAISSVSFFRLVPIHADLRYLKLKISVPEYLSASGELAV